MPGEVTEEALRLVAGAQWQCAKRGGQIEERDHAHPRHDIAEASERHWVADRGGDAVDAGADVDGPHLDAERLRDQLGVREALGRRRAVRHPDPDDIVRPQRLGGEIRNERAVHAARKADHTPGEAAPADELVTKEFDQPAAGERGFDGKRGDGRYGRTGGTGGTGGTGSGSRSAVRREPALPVPPASPPPGLQQVREPALEVGEQRHVGAGARNLVEMENRRNDRILKDGGSGNEVAAGAGNDGSARERFPTLEAYELCDGDEYAVLPGDILRDALPPGETRGSIGILIRVDSPGGTRAGDDEQLRAVERGEHRHHRVPSIFTDENRRPAPPRVERLDRATALDEALFVEYPVRRQENLPMHVTDPGVGAAERGVERRIVEPVLEQLVEAETDFEGRGGRFAMLRAQILEELTGRHCRLAHAALEKVPGKGRLGGHHEVRGMLPAPDSAKRLAKLREILAIGALAGPQLRDGQVKH